MSPKRASVCGATASVTRTKMSGHSASDQSCQRSRMDVEYTERISARNQRERQHTWHSSPCLAMRRLMVPVEGTPGSPMTCASRCRYPASRGTESRSDGRGM